MAKMELWIYLLTVFIILQKSSCQSNDENKKPRIYYHHIQSDIKYRFATTLVTSKVVNPSNVSEEAVFDVTLPNEAFISDFIMEIDGRIYPSQIDDKEKAKKQYGTAELKIPSARQNNLSRRETSRFRVTVNISSMSRVTFNLTYQEVLRRRTGSYHHVIYVQPGQIVDDLLIDVSILESRDITDLALPTSKDETLTEKTNFIDRKKFARIQRPTSKSCKIRYNPGVDDQRLRSERGINEMFVVEYDIARRLDAGDVLIADDHFVHFFSPQGLDPIPKDVLFILDVSTSMVGPKLKQLKDAMKRILKDLRKGDNFNIVLFNTGATFWKPGVIVPVTRDNIVEAIAYIRRAKASGWTNINEALTFGVDFLNGLELEEDRSPVIVFLTDGKASTGELITDTILQNVKLRNSKQIPVFSLAFGKGADYELVKKVAIQNSGVGRRIYEGSDSALQIKRFYDEISTTTLKNVTFDYLDGSGGVENLTKTDFNSYYDGSEIIVAGKINQNEIDTLSLDVSGTGVHGQMELSLTTGMSDQPAGDDQVTEKVWAYLTIKQLLEQAIGETKPAEQERLRHKALNLSTKYKFVTPLTSMIVTKPDEQIVVELEDDEDTELFGQHLSIKQNSTGSNGNSGGSYQGGGGGDPHFMIRVKEIKHPICFDYDAKSGQNIRLLKDRRRGITINAGIISFMSMNKHGLQKTFMGEVVVITKRFTLSVNTTHIFMNGVPLSWDTEVPYKYRGANINVVRKDTTHRLLYVDLGHDVRVIIKRVEHITVDYLNVFLDREAGLSRGATGIIGQFVYKKMKIVKIHRNNRGDKVMGKLKVSEKGIHKKIRTNLVSKPDVITGNHELCWSVHRSVKGLFGGKHSDYIIKSVYSP